MDLFEFGNSDTQYSGDPNTELVGIQIMYVCLLNGLLFNSWPKNKLMVSNSSHDPLMFFQVIGCVINGSITNLKVQYSNDIWTPDHLASNLFLPFKYN